MAVNEALRFYCLGRLLRFIAVTESNCDCGIRDVMAILNQARFSSVNYESPILKILHDIEQSCVTLFNMIQQFT